MNDIKNKSILIDSDVIIDHLRGIGNFGKIINNTSNNKCHISVISIVEVYSNLFPNEYKVVEMLLSELKIVNLDMIISKLAGNYRMIFYKSHSLKIPDAVIAATAKFTNTILVTKNLKHFPMNDIQIIKPYWFTTNCISYY